MEAFLDLHVNVIVCVCVCVGLGSCQPGGSVALHGGDEGEVIRCRGELKEDEMVESLDLGRGFWLHISGPLSNLGCVTPPLQASISFLI